MEETQVSAQGDIRRLIRHGNGGNYLTGRVMRYLQEHGEVDFSTDPRVRKIMMEVMSAKRFRLPGIHPSAMFKCSRMQMFEYMSVPSVPAGRVAVRNMDLQQIFNIGTWSHYRWQTMLLLVGAIHGVEVPVRDRSRRIIGAMDGEGEHNGLWMFEFKTIYRLHNDLPYRDHLLQKHGYFAGKPELDYGIIVYEDKGTGRFTEERVEKDPKMMRQVNGRIDRLNRYIDEQELPNALPDCIKKKGAEYKDCAYKEVCPTYHHWSQLEADGEDPDQVIAKAEAQARKVVKPGGRRIHAPTEVSIGKRPSNPG